MEYTTDNTPKELSRYERKRMEREERERLHQAAEKKKKIKKYAIGIVVLLGLGAGMYGLMRSANKSALTQTSVGERLADKGRNHATNIDINDYNSIPPTSGPHFGSQTNWGIHKEPVPEGYQVHNLEHGGVLIQYKPDLSAEIVEKLKAIGESYNWKKLILAPYGPLDKNIALTAWTRLDKFDDFDEARIRAFIDTWRNHGPENVPDNMQSVTLP